MEKIQDPAGIQTQDILNKSQKSFSEQKQAHVGLEPCNEMGTTPHLAPFRSLRHFRSAIKMLQKMPYQQTQMM